MSSVSLPARREDRPRARGAADWRALGALAFVEAAAFGFYARGIGFYHDDWVLLDQMSAAHGFCERVKALAWLATRPMDILLYPALYSLAGMSGLGQHLLRMAAELLAAFLFYRLLKRLTRLPRFALVSAALALVVPNHEVIHFWFGIANESWAIALTFAGLLVHLDWVEKGGRVRLAGSLSLYLASLLMYEALAFFPLALAAALAARALAEGQSRRRALALAWKALWPFGPVMAAGLLWQRVGATLLLATVNNKAAGFSPAHVVKVFGAGLECVSNRVFHISFLSVKGALGVLPSWAWPASVAAAIAATWALGAGEEEKRGVPAAAWAFGVGAWVAAYAPYALTADYTPQIFGIMSRTNAGGAWPAGMLFAGLALLARRRSALVVGLLLSVFCLTDWYRGLQWARSWSIQSEIMAAMKADSARIPPGALVLLRDAPKDVQWAIVFDASWDFDGALRCATGRQDVRGDIFGRVPHDEPGALVYDYKSGTLAPLR